MLATDRLQRMFYRQFAPIYEDGTLEAWASSPFRDPDTGVFPFAMVGMAPIKVQRDQCTEAQRMADGYAPTDVRFLVLQYGVNIIPNTDSRVVYRGENYRVMSVDQDPARAYWDFRARLVIE